jgi:hypothetical protein
MKKNRNCSWLISVALVMGFVMAQEAFAQASDFEIKDGVLVKYRGNAAEAVIPAGVTAIGERAFGWKGSLVSVTIPAGVTSIGSGAFAGCSSLVSVTIPASVTSIGGRVFALCKSLKAISVPPENRQYTDIGGVLLSKDGKTLVQYPAGQTQTAYTIPAGVTTIGEWAFDGCSSLASVTIPAGVTTIGGGAFERCSSLVSVTIPASVTTIGESAFDGCESLKPEVRADIEKRFGIYFFYDPNGR